MEHDKQDGSESRDEAGTKRRYVLWDGEQGLKIQILFSNIIFTMEGREGRAELKKKISGHIFQEEPGCYFGKKQAMMDTVIGGQILVYLRGYEPLGFLVSLDVGCDQNKHQQ